MPVGTGTLLVDAAALDGAIAIYVQIEPGTLVTAQVRKTTVTRGSKLPPLALLTVTDAVFKPVAGDKSTAFEAGQNASIYSTSLYAEMGTQMRQIRTRLKSVDTEGRMKLTSAMLPGDSASPVISTEGVLLGFAAARTDVMVESGGPDAVFAAQGHPAPARPGEKGRLADRIQRLQRRQADHAPAAAQGNHFL